MEDAEKAMQYPAKETAVKHERIVKEPFARRAAQHRLLAVGAIVSRKRRNTISTAPHTSASASGTMRPYSS
jgi:hypothetical protein